MSIFGTKSSLPNIVDNDLALWFDAGQTVSYGKRANAVTGDRWMDRASGITGSINNSFTNSQFLWNSASGGYFEEFASNDNYITLNTPNFTNLTQITIQAVFMYTAGQFEGPKFLNISGSSGQVELGTGFGGNDVGVILYGGTTSFSCENTKVAAKMIKIFNCAIWINKFIKTECGLIRHKRYISNTKN
jgi:hypothetical protein